MQSLHSPGSGIWIFWVASVELPPYLLEDIQIFSRRPDSVILQHTVTCSNTPGAQSRSRSQASVPTVHFLFNGILSFPLWMQRANKASSTELEARQMEEHKALRSWRRLCTFWTATCRQCSKITISVQNNQVSILSLINEPPSPGNTQFPGKHIFSDKGTAERSIKWTAAHKSPWRSQVRQTNPVPINQLMQRSFTSAENTLKSSWQKNWSRKRNP